MRRKYTRALWQVGACAALFGAMAACSDEEPAVEPDTNEPDATPSTDASARPDGAALPDAGPVDAGDTDAADASEPDPVDASDASDFDAADASDEVDADAAAPDPFCGDGRTTLPEACDDGNTTDGDGCSSTCTIETGWTCTGEPSACSDIDECAPNPCANDGICTDAIASYTCACIANYQGPQCATCAPDRADCNGQTPDGCETNTASDRNHCGVCGNACAGATTCSQSECKAIAPAQLGAPVHFVAAHAPMAPAVADFDKDGKLDILVANADAGSTGAPSGSLSVFKGNGNGTVQAEVRSIGAALSSNAVVAVDVNGDGWLDAVTVDGQTNLPASSGALSVYLNAANASGTFTYAASYTTGAPGSVHLCAGDFDGDGRSDIATTSVVTSQVSVLRGAANGGFEAPVLVNIQSTGGVQSSIGCRDLNGDGRPDLAVTSPSSARVAVLLNQGNGTFAAPVSYTNALNGQTAGIAFGDADGDGRVDLLSNGAAGAYVFWFKGNGNGTFASGVQSATGSGAVANSALGLVARDFNGDGKLDVYVLRTAAAGGLVPMTGNGVGAFTAGGIVAIGTSPALNAIAAADLDGNGYDDLVVTNRGSNTLTFVPNAL